MAQALMLVAIKTVAMVSITAKHQEMMHEQIQKVDQHKATKLDQLKAKTQRTCLKRHVTKRCRNPLYLFRQAQVAISLIVKMQLDLMKVAAMQAERIPTRIAHTEAVAEVVNSSCHIKNLKLNTPYKNRLKSYPTFFYIL
jgi:hypothetical protein